MRRIQEKKPVEKTIWEPVSVPMARFIAFEQMAKSVRRRSRLGTDFARGFLRTATDEPQNPIA